MQLLAFLQAWLEAQMDKGEEQKEPEPEPELVVTAEPAGGYDDVMKMIEDNRCAHIARPVCTPQ